MALLAASRSVTIIVRVKTVMNRGKNMEIERHEVEGESLITLKSHSGLTLTLSPFGAGIYSITYLDKPMTSEPLSPKDYVSSTGYYGKTAGRIAGRISNSILDFDGKKYKVSSNEGPNCLHGGNRGLAFQEWSFSLNDEGEQISADFILDSKDQDNGFPGDVRFLVRYILSDKEPVFRIVYQYMADKDTPINLTSHTYFNLGGEITIEGHLLTLPALGVESYTPDLIPLGMGKVAPALDFSSPKAIGKDINDPLLHLTRTNGYDHAFLFDKKEGRADLTLESEHFKMSIVTSLPAVQVYSANYPSSVIMNTGKKDLPHSGVAIEPVFVPGDYESMRAKANEKKEEFIEYAFSSKEEK